MNKTRMGRLAPVWEWDRFVGEPDAGGGEGKDTGQ